METPGEKNDAKAASFYGTKPVFAGQKSNSNRTSCKDRIMSLFSSIGNKSGKGRKIEADRIKIVLLLMDLASRRFELLQLEFDSLRKCTVSHVLSQIALCATTASLRLQKYSCIAGNDGVEMPSSSILESFCRGNELLVAIPEGLTAEECILHARPILLDKKVRNMLASNGVDATGWATAPENKTLASCGNFSDDKSRHGIEPKENGCLLTIVLLLMDVATRRFELLKLEFDSRDALVADVLAEIPIRVSEAVLRRQNYIGILRKDGGFEMEPSRLLAHFCAGNEVLVAIQEGLPAEECVGLARPILSDGVVINMLASNGIDATGWKIAHGATVSTGLG